jgi:hypothetical protein
MRLLVSGVSLFGSILAACVISSSHHANDLASGLRGARSLPQGISLPEVVVKQGKIPPPNLTPQRRRRRRRRRGR